ncbi:hydroxyneurosporene dehydrogenase [Actinacidiphila soli]|uniref:hydroxyneurosporene dehydrogenase n=1 Tax=Actinacidiphila soli TaxID=2487275 RepID=UPI000FCB0F05|nr:hydroxyneurosporene dehydrogenase [Actinacidiphila soli]
MSRTRAATPVPARMGSTPEAYARFGIEPRVIKPSEDGMRTDGCKGTYEWWYFDAHLDDDAMLVVAFMTKEFTDLNKPLSPVIRIDLTLPDGTQLNKLVELPADSFSAFTETCDVRIGDSVFAGDLHAYTIRARVEEVEVEVRLTGQVPAWRPETGHWLFGEDGESYFAWLPAVPQGVVEATYSVGGDSHTVTGVGYHDHNWGNASVLDLMHHGYWARGAAGPYSVIASYITAQERYGYAALPVFMLARDGQLIADDAGKVTFEALGRYTDAKTGKPVDNITRYTYTDGEERYVITYTRHADLAANRFVDDLKGPKKVAAKLIGFDGAYLRFAGELRIERYEDDELAESYTDNALCELMYFGKARP